MIRTTKWLTGALTLLALCGCQGAGGQERQVTAGPLSKEERHTSLPTILPDNTVFPEREPLAQGIGVTPQSAATLHPVPTPEPSPEDQPTAAPSAKESGESDAMTTITITAGGSAFSARLYNNDAAKTMLARLPMTLNMSELNGNEKFYYLPDGLPADAQRIGDIRAGDVMLYGSDCLVLFYQSFTSAYSYTKLGYMEDASGLAAALGSGGVEVTFAVGN